MSNWSFDAVYRPSWRDVGRRNLHIVLAIVAGLVGTAAFLLWGPIGIGNGPLQASAGGAESGGVGGKAPLAIFVPLFNAGRAAVTVDSIAAAGGGSYQAPVVVATEAMTPDYPDCPDLAAVRFGSAGFAVAGGCSGRPAGQLAGRSVMPGTYPMAVLAVRAQPPGQCWLLADVIVGYHVNDRYYTGTYPHVIADCGPHGSWRAEDVASQISRQADP